MAGTAVRTDAETTLEDRLSTRAKSALRAIRSSSMPEILIENSVEGLVTERIVDHDEYLRLTQAPSASSTPRVALSAKQLGMLAGITARDIERRIAECVAYVLEDPELAPEARIHQTTEMLHALTGGMKPRR